MEKRHANLIKDFEINLRKLIREHNLLKEENARLKNELQIKQEDLIGAHSEITDLRNQIISFQTANAVSGSVYDRELSRKHLSKMVQEIDKCLALLNR